MAGPAGVMSAGMAEKAVNNIAHKRRSCDMGSDAGVNMASALTHAPSGATIKLLWFQACIARHLLEAHDFVTDPLLQLCRCGR